MLKGCFTALVTPFKDGEIDWESFEKHVRRQIDSGINGLVPCGTTGEAPTLTEEEHLAVVRKTVDLAHNKIPVMAGCGTNSTAKTIALAEKITAFKADALLVVTPYYNRPSQRGLYRHYADLASSIKTPICIYNVPSRTGVNIEPATVLRLAEEFPNIKAVKEASGILDQAGAICREALPGFSVFCGDDSLTLPMLAVGSHGVISVASNIVPKEMSGMLSAWSRGKCNDARKIHQKLFRLFKALFIEANPVPVKWVLRRLGIISSGELRRPLSDLDPANAPKLEQVLTELGLLPSGTARKAR
ncbi:MAG: 4-hydroxy-tetrahydrodipicolinate synthase [Elusimicrobia bacterium]|nr:4-hydroxy-tetrahydrodipicolinate synthase [Elusimicrobiota bacterium]